MENNGIVENKAEEVIPKKLNEDLLFYCYIKDLPKSYGLSIEATAIFGYCIKEVEKQKSNSIDYKPYTIADRLNMSYKTAKNYIDELLATDTPLIKIEKNKISINRSDKEIKMMLKSGFCKMYTVLFDVFKLKIKYVIAYGLYCERQLIALNSGLNSFEFQNKLMNKNLKISDKNLVKKICDKLIEFDLLEKESKNKMKSFSLITKDITLTKVWKSVEKTGTTQWKKPERESDKISNDSVEKTGVNNIINKRLEEKEEKVSINKEIATATTSHMIGEKKEVIQKMIANGYYNPNNSNFNVMDFYHKRKCTVIRKIFDYKINISCNEIELLDEYLYDSINELNNKYNEICEDKLIKLQYVNIIDIFETYDTETNEIEASSIIRPFLKKYERALRNETKKIKTNNDDGFRSL